MTGSTGLPSKHCHRWTDAHLRAQELWESGGGRPGLPPSLIVRTVSVDVKQNFKKKMVVQSSSRGVRPGLPVPNSLSVLCGREVTLNLNSSMTTLAKIEQTAQRRSVLDSLQIEI